MQNSKIKEFAALVMKSAESETLVNTVFHSPVGGDMKKSKGVLKKISGEIVLQVETFLTEGRVSQENIRVCDIMSAIPRYFDMYRLADLADSGGSASLMTSKKGTVTLIKKGKIGEGAAITIRDSNDRQKRHLLRGDESFLISLGVSDSKGRVHDKMQAKFRQICRFSEYIVEAEKKLKRDGELYICDLCCGKSYLSFAAYHVLTEVLGRQIKMTCVDLKQSVMDYCAEIAKNSGMTGMEFVCMNIDDFVPPRAPDLVISLHACDTATDTVLSFAAKYRADAILSTPCCHHYMNKNINCSALSFVTDSSILRQKLCDAATDALRLLKLEAEGYKTDATELIDPEDTPKNVMLRAYRRKNFDAASAEAVKKAEEYRAAYRFIYGAEPSN